MKIRSKLLYAFILVIAVAVTVMAMSSRMYITSIFDRYVGGYREVVVEQWEYVFSSYYLAQGSWDGVENTLFGRHRGRGMLVTPGQPKGGIQSILPGERLILVDLNGQVVLDSHLEKTGSNLSPDYIKLGTPLYLEDQQIGTIVLQPQTSRTLQTLEKQFSHSTLLAVFWGGLFALLIGTILSLILTGQIARPLALLTASAQKYARRDFKNRVQIKSKDEIGKLAEAFNLMAESIETNERLRNNLMADVSHELRTPLTILRGNFEALQAGKIQPSAELLSSLYDEVIRLGRLVSDLESINLAEAGKLPLHQEHVAVSALMHRAAAPFQYEADERKIDFTVEISPEVGQFSLDEDRIVQVLINILANAFKFTPDTGNIVLRTRMENQNLVVEIKDSGPGIPARDLPFVFERFYKSGTGRSRGTGLGLFIAKSFIEVHGGTIKAANCPAGGSIFTFILPPANPVSSY
jgi:signal transduction histidine kinase